MISTIPPTLDLFYDQMFARIDECYASQVKLALQFIAFSPRPLSLDELGEAMLLRPESGDLFDPADRFQNLSEIFQILPSWLISRQELPSPFLPVNTSCD